MLSTRTGWLMTAAGAVFAASACIVLHVDQRPDVGTRVRTDVEMMRQAMAEVRALGTSIEAFSVDTNRYPTATDSDRTVDGFPLSKVETLATDLALYARPFPKLDPWNSPYLFWSDGQHYAVICLAADASLSHPGALAEALRALSRGEEVERFQSKCVEDDLVFANGAFVWFPLDPIRRCDRSAGADGRAVDDDAPGTMLRAAPAGEPQVSLEQ